MRSPAVADPFPEPAQGSLKGLPLPAHNHRSQMTNTSNAKTTKAAAAAAADPAALLMAALQASAKTNPSRTTSRSTAAPEQLAQPLTDRDRAALEQLGWTGKLSSPKPAEPKPTAKVKAGPVINPATYGDLSPERQASSQFWAGLCSVLARSNGRVWLPEAAAVAAHLGVEITSPAQLAARLSALTGLPVSRPTDAAGWLICDIQDPMPAADVWAQLFNAHASAYGAAAAAR